MIYSCIQYFKVFYYNIITFFSWPSRPSRPIHSEDIPGSDHNEDHFEDDKRTTEVRDYETDTSDWAAARPWPHGHQDHWPDETDPTNISSLWNQTATVEDKLSDFLLIMCYCVYINVLLLSFINSHH